MGQEEIVNLLEEKREPLTGREIAEMLEEPISKIFKILGVLVERKEIKSIELDRKLSMKFYKCKRRMRLYLA